MATYPASRPAKCLIWVLKEESELRDDQLDAINNGSPVAKDVALMVDRFLTRSGLVQRRARGPLTTCAEEVCGTVLHL